MRRTTPILICLTLMLTVPASASALPPFGGLSQSPGADGCVSNDGSPGCSTGTNLAGPESMAISPDGKSVYAGSLFGNSVVGFSRNSVSGALAQTSCHSQGASPGCTTAANINFPYDMVVSPDGRQLYVVSRLYEAVLTFNRDTNTGGLTYQACLSSDVAAPPSCAGTLGVNVLNGANAIAISPNGQSVYVTASNSDKLVRFDRNLSTGVLSSPGSPTSINAPSDVAVSPDGNNVYVATNGDSTVATFARAADGSLMATTGCIEQVPSPACTPTNGHGLANTQRLAISPTGNNVYVASRTSNAVAILDRSASTGALTQDGGPAGCISSSDLSCQSGTALNSPTSIAISPDGKSVYTGSGENPDTGPNAIAILSRDPSSGDLVQLAAPNGCLNETGGPCTVGRAINDLDSLEVSPDGNSVYAGSFNDNAIGVYARELPPSCTSPPTQTFRNDKGGDVPLPCTDPNGDPVILRSVATKPQYGTVTINNSAGRAAYAPTSHYHGDDSFSFVGSDGSTTSVPALARVDLTDKIGPFIRFGKGTLRMNRAGKVPVKLICPAGEQDGCQKGKLKIGSSKRINITLHKRRKAKLTLGSVKFTLKGGQTKRVRVKLTRTARRVVRHLKDVRVNLTATVRDPAGNAGKTTQSNHLKRPR